MSLGVTSVAFAQNPTPGSNFGNFEPPSANTNWAGIVVEGLGSGSCSYSQSAIQQMTAKYVNDKLPVMTELSPQSSCNSISNYESEIKAIKSYVVNNASSTYQQYWAGFMLDEETGFGFSASQLESLNSYVTNLMLGVSGVPWFFTEVFSGQGDWSQSTYNSIVSGSVPAPQIATSYMVNLTNGDTNAAANLVTWSTSYASPYNTLVGATGAINGLPWDENYKNPTGPDQYWANHFCPGSC